MIFQKAINQPPPVSLCVCCKPFHRMQIDVGGAAMLDREGSRGTSATSKETRWRNAATAE